MLFDYNGKCTECQSEELLYDKLKGEIFCRHCGLIIEDRYSFASIPDMMMKSHLEGRLEARKLNEEMMKEHLQ